MIKITGLILTLIILINVVQSLEYLNRRIYSFNRGSDMIFFEKTTSIYTEILPKSLKENINIFFKHIENFQELQYNIIQFNLTCIKLNFNKIKINTIPFKILELIKNNNTLQSQSNIINNNIQSNYLILPFIGPNFFNEHIKLIYNQIFNPFLYSENVLIYYILYIINKRILLNYNINLFNNIIPDGYTFLKSLFLQYNDKKY